MRVLACLHLRTGHFFTHHQQCDEPLGIYLISYSSQNVVLVHYILNFMDLFLQCLIIELDGGSVGPKADDDDGDEATMTNKSTEEFSQESPLAVPLEMLLSVRSSRPASQIEVYDH